MRAVRVLFAVLVLLILGGPTPGAVGSCDAEDSDADLYAFCRSREELTCWRRGLRRELTENAVNQCRVDAVAKCQQSSWAPGCKPTQRQADACINALRAMDTLQTKESKIAECKQKSICTATEIKKPSAAAADGGVSQ
jgi:hypothetical protein